MLLASHEGPIRILNYIDGAFKAPRVSSFFKSVNPATQQTVAEVPHSQAIDVDDAVAAATRAAPIWRNTPARARANWLRQIANAINENAAELALAECNDNGKPLSLAQSVDIPRAAYNFEFFADAATQFSGASFSTDGLANNQTLYQPLGVVGCISPWNLPLYLFSWKIAPALAAGNTVVAKPSEVTPLTAYLLSRICAQIGLPKGVLNVVHGQGHCAGEAIVAHNDVKAISFTGSTGVGRKIANIAANTFKKVSLEMGGKNPFIVFDDADFELSIETAVRAAFSNQGQICLCSSRFLVQDSIYEKFKKKFIEATLQLRVGDPLEPTTHLGALVSKQQFEKVTSYIDIAQGEGGRILCGGKPVNLSGRCHGGWFFPPTIIEGLNMDAQTNQDEIFGPIVTLMPFSTEQEAVYLANHTRYGLSACVMTENVRRANRVSEALETGIVWVNTWMLRDLRTPFGGVKESGIGREGGFDALRFMSEVKNVCTAK